ncbi:abc multidrug transporter B [Hyphodiscus hymeniophilus]|uniref:Abc multidrug transporter B n=1 Tax=Hyphodiscus hymeniophilus TaxID=353542 RepID=A0A9P6VQG9_9HELO|nr:abc multidrug transporter B [Hyphodiscus hymeniophilus]
MPSALLLRLRVATISLISGFYLALLILWIVKPGVQTSASVPSVVLTLAAALVLYPLSYLEHTRSIRPSTLIEIYLLFSVLLNIPQARTLFLRPNETAIAAVFVATIVAMFILWALETRNKTKYLKEIYRGYHPEATRGIWSRTFFIWLNRLFVKGFRNVLTLDDLWQTPPEISSERLRDDMQAVWNHRSKPEGRYALMWACTKCLVWPLLSVAPARICLIGFNYAQPFLISRMINFVSEPQNTLYKNESKGLIAAAALIYIGVAISTVSYTHQLYRSITMLRGGLVGLVFNKLLILRDGVFDESATLTLMSTDIDRIATSMQNMHEVWARLIEVAIGIWLLSAQLGAVSVIPVLVVVVGAAVNTRASYYSSDKQKLWNGAVQTRISSTASVLGSIKSVKMMGLQGLLSKKIQNQRIAEMKSANGYRWLVLFTNMIGYLPQVFGPILTFVAFEVRARIQGSTSLSTNQAITSLSVITLLTTPASTLLTAIPDTATAIGCFERIQKFLVAPSWEDSRSGPERIRTRSTSPSSASKEDRSYELREPSDFEMKPVAPVSQSVNDIAINITNLSARPSPTAEIAISNINLQLKPATTTIITGPVGSGKSTLMRAILGELCLDSGDISVSSKNMAYCSQTPWILNTTIKQNICGLKTSSAIDEGWYQSVLHACALDQDLLQLTDGDQGELGSRGITLSGGQKQRIALARAVYARPEIVLLDDVLSALDSKTETLVVDRLLGRNGLFRKLKSTIILITYSTRQFHIADHFVAMSTDGRVAQQGVLGELREQPGYLQNLFQDTKQGTTKVLRTVNPPQMKKRPAIKGVTANDVSDLTRKTGDFTVYKYYFRSIDLFGSICFLLATGAFVFTQFFPQYWLVWWTEADGHQTAKYISVYVLLGVASCFFRAALLWWILLSISPRSSIKLHEILLSTTMKAPQAFFAETDTGVTLNRFSQDMGLIDRVLPLSFARMALAIFTILAQAALIAQGSSYTGIVIPFIAVALYVLQKIYLFTSRQLRFLDLEARSPVYSHFLECLEGLSTIRAFGWSYAAQEIEIERLDVSQKPYYLLFCIQRWLRLVLDLIVAFISIAVVALAVEIPGQTSGVAVGIALNNVLGFSQTLKTLVDSWTQLETSLGAIARLKNFEETTPSEDKSDESYTPPSSWPETGEIEFRDVTASYGPSAPALHSISMKILPGQKIGICGRTGSLCRLIELDSGSISIDGIDLRTVPREVLRSRITAIPQDPFVLSDTVRVNADTSGEASDDIIISALKKVQLWNIVSARGGLDAQMKSQPLSQGQQQLFCLARAMLCQSKILILDEATSNVDGETDALMQRVIREAFAQHTIITIAHRLNTILDSDMVAVLNEGRLIEFGPPEELLQKPSMFRDLNDV